MDRFVRKFLHSVSRSRKCIDSSHHQLVFALKKGTDTTIFWKATVRIACVKVQLQPRRIEQYRLLNLKQFLSVFRTFEMHLNALIRSEDNGCNTSMLMDTVRAIADGGTRARDGSSSSTAAAAPPPLALVSDDDECIICMDRKSDVLLSCAHSFCCPCIEQWKVQNSNCPVCQEAIDDDWVLSETPNADEINEQICAELFKLSSRPQENSSSSPQQSTPTSPSRQAAT